MEIELVSHASIKIKNLKEKVLLTDPWFISPVFWGSWFLCHEPKISENIYQNTNFIYLTHWHFDHFDYKTIRNFSKNVKFYVPKFPSSIMKQELNKLGFFNVFEMENKKEYLLDDNFSIISHQIEHHDDSALIIKVDNKVIVNLNDAKPLPSSWKWLKKNFENPDFLFRSHSIAWSYPTKYIFHKDDFETLSKETYMNEFIQAVKYLNPKFAVPHASYICHLHKETEGDNKHLITPYDLQIFFLKNYNGESKFKIMNPGGKYSDKKDFYDIKDYVFEDEVSSLKKKYTEYLNNLYDKENNYETDFNIVKEYFYKFIKSLGILRFTLKDFILIIITENEKILINLYKKKVELLTSFDENSNKYSAIIYVHKSVFYKSLKSFIFSNIDISKRCKVNVSRGCVQKYLYLTALISIYEGGLLPILPNLLKPRFVIGYLKRLPELIDYIIVAIKLKKSVSSARSYISGSNK